MKTPLSSLLLIIILLAACSKDSTTEPNEEPVIFETPQQIIGQITRGINIGNTLEPPTEGGWNNGPLQQYYFDDYKNAGFTCVRIPIRWEQHTAETAPYTVEPSWMARVEQVVDWGLARDLYIIINAHHDWWLVNGYGDANVRDRFASIWTQVSERFKDKSPKLLFEIINEPNGLTQDDINQLNANILSIIRQTNPRRIVIYSGHDWAGSDQLMSAAIPADDYIMGYYHSYDPWTFAGEANGVWGSSSDINAIKTKFEQVAAWSLSSNIPVMISEFGAVQACDYNSRMRHYATYVEQALTNGIAFQAWDDGGQFGIYERNSRRWSEVKDILIHSDPQGPAFLESNLHANAVVYLTWQNRSSDAGAIIVERKIGAADFMEVARLDAAADDYRDTQTGSGDHYYRVIYDFSTQPDIYSNPVKVAIP